MKWSPISTAPSGVLILTKIEDKWGQRNVQKLLRVGETWFRPGQRGKVYYTPTHWWQPSVRIAKSRKRRTAKSLSALRKQLVEIQRRRCGICGGPLAEYDPRPGAPFQASVEHVVPRKRGGGTARNVFASHNRCNAEKADRPPTGCELVYLEFVNARLAQGGEARQGGNSAGGSVHEHPVAEGHAPVV